MQTSAVVFSRSSRDSGLSSARSASWSQRERGPAIASTLPMAEVVGLGERGAHLSLACCVARERCEGDDLVDDHVPVLLEALEAAAREEERLAADEHAEALVDLRRDDEVHLTVLVLEEHEDDTVRR